MPILDPNRNYTFRDIFNLKIEVDRLVVEFGYCLKRTALNLPQYPEPLDRLALTRSQIEEILPYVNLANEATRREVLIARIVTDLVHYTQSQLRIEYPIKVSRHLQGNVDYYLRSQTQMLVLEAKQEDLTNGFTQLAAELIALDQWEDTTSIEQQAQIIGDVTTDSLWQFAVLHRSTKQIEQGLNSYRVPEDLEPLTRILVQSLMA